MTWTVQELLSYRARTGPRQISWPGAWLPSMIGVGAQRLAALQCKLRLMRRSALEDDVERSLGAGAERNGRCSERGNLTVLLAGSVTVAYEQLTLALKRRQGSDELETAVCVGSADRCDREGCDLAGLVPVCRSRWGFCRLWGEREELVCDSTL